MSALSSDTVCLQLQSGSTFRGQRVGLSTNKLDGSSTLSLGAVYNQSDKIRDGDEGIKYNWKIIS